MIDDLITSIKEWRRSRYVMPDDPMHADRHNATMRHALSLCVPCSLCGGSAEITDAGTGFGYWIACQNAKRSRNPCVCSGARLSGDAYNVLVLWNRLHIRALPAADSGALGAVAMRDEAAATAEDYASVKWDEWHREYLPVQLSCADAIRAIPLPTHAAQLAAALRLPEVAALRDALEALRHRQSLYSGHTDNALVNLADAALAALEARHE